MDLGLREWMVLIGGLLILAVVVDGLRRMQKARKNNVKLSKRARKWKFEGGDEDKLSELPSGKARVIGRDDENYGEENTAPILMTPVRSFETIEEEPVAQPAQEEMVLEAAVEVVPEVQVSEQTVESAVAEPEPQQATDNNLEEVFVINVLSKDENGYSGAKLLEILLACDVRYGDMDIFHRSEGKKGGGKHQFSVANLVEPGTFNLDGMRHMKTPGIVFFTRLPGPNNAMEAFDSMVEIAECVVRNLGGEMRDQARCVMTKQTIAHDRERVRELERRLLALQS